MKTWCSDITWFEGRSVWFLQDAGVTVNPNWKECPICLTPRPKEPMNLAEKLYKVWVADVDELAFSTCERQSKAAIEAVFEVMDDYREKNRYLTVEELKQEIREKLG